VGRTLANVVVFALQELHAFYRAFALSLEHGEVFGCNEAPRQIRRGLADLAVIDCGFKVESGLKLLREIKKASPGTIVVLVAENSSEDAVIEAFHAGARRYLKKPVTVAQLRRVAEGLLCLRCEAQEERRPFLEASEKDRALPGDVSSGHPANLLRAAQYIVENLSEPLDLESCARAGNLSKYQFCRAFHKHFGMAPINFIRSLRVSRAKELLRRDNLNITEVALYVGFRDHRGFIRAFKTQTGMLPSEFKRSVRTGPGLRSPGAC
jgi:AraC-like DNA-binding protein